MNEVIRLMSKLRELQYRPESVLYSKLLGWLEDGGLESLRQPLERDLINLTVDDIEVPVQCLDRALTDPPFYYHMKVVDTLEDLKQQFAEHESVPPEQVRFMSVGPTVKYKGEYIGGKTSRLRDELVPLSHLRDITLVAYPYTYSWGDSGNRYAQRINWTEYPTQTIHIRSDPDGFELKYSPGTTVDDLKLRLWVIWEIHPYEQMLTLYGDSSENIGREIPAHAEGYQFNVKTHPLTVYGPLNFTQQIQISAYSDGDELVENVEQHLESPGMYVENMWLGTPNDPTRQNLAHENDILYRFLLLHPDKDVHVQIEQEG